MLSNCFKSFSEIDATLPRLRLVLPDHDIYFAHTPQEDKKNQDKEKLIEHVELVVNYALQLIAEHHLNSVADQLIYSIVQHKSPVKTQILGDYVKTVFLNSIVYHDYGKVNENFQRERMENDHPKFATIINNEIKNKHSILSAFVFINYHIKEIVSLPGFDDSDKELLYGITFLFANSILKHHASFLAHQLDFEQVIEPLKSYLPLFKAKMPDEYIESIFSHLENCEACILDNLFRFMEKNDLNFHAFALLKLNFSLLTAADYYATTEYMNDLRTTDFGVLSNQDKEELYRRFWSFDYNAALKDNFDLYQNSFDWDSVQERCQKNLNKLRSKMVVEAMGSVRKNAHENVFYLEAPTGAGKTNLSLALALELLTINPELNKIYYVFPFTTLVTQTFNSIKETLTLNNDQIIQLHSRAGFHQKDENSNEADAKYGKDKRNYIDNLFVNYPVTLMTHVRFFDVLKSNRKESNYLLHRLANSVVIIDELQSYPPLEWDKIRYFIDEYARYFNIKFVLMSATLPKLDGIKTKEDQPPETFVKLISNKDDYFHNPNFRDRVSFDFSLLVEKKWDVERLAKKIHEICLDFEQSNNGKSKVIVEFITKKSASNFYNEIENKGLFEDYKIYVLSGTILQPRRTEVIDAIKSNKHQKLLLICTQVVEAGVDIDMDIGFKDKSLLDNEEQFAGRVNREAKKPQSKVYLFKLDHEYHVYGKDLRYKMMKTEKEIIENYERILKEKDFDLLYRLVTDYIDKMNRDPFTGGLAHYKAYLQKLNFQKVDSKFKIIDNNSYSVYVPLKISAEAMKDDLPFLKDLGIYNDEKEVCGEKVWNAYKSIIKNDEQEFFAKKIDLKRIYGVMSNFMFSVYEKQWEALQTYADLEEISDILYLLHHDKIYDYESGIKENELKKTYGFF